MLYLVAAVALCVHVRGGGGGANLNTVKTLTLVYTGLPVLIDSQA